MNIDIDKTRMVIDKLIEEKKKFSEFMNKSFKEFDDIDGKKEEIQSILRSFICTKGGYVLVHRDSQGDRIIITKTGIKKIKYKHQRGISLDNSDIFALFMDLRGDSASSKRIMRNPQIKLRVQCYVKALIYMEEFYDAWEEYKKLNEIKVGKFDNPKIIKDMGEPFYYFSINYGSISFYTESDVRENTIKEIVNGKCYSSFSIEYNTVDAEEMVVFLDNYSRIKDKMNKLNSMFPFIKKKIDDAIAKVMKELAPVLTLEAIALD